MKTIICIISITLSFQNSGNTQMVISGDYVPGSMTYDTPELLVVTDETVIRPDQIWNLSTNHIQTGTNVTLTPLQDTAIGIFSSHEAASLSWDHMGVLINKGFTLQFHTAISLDVSGKDTWSIFGQIDLTHDNVIYLNDSDLIFTGDGKWKTIPGYPAFVTNGLGKVQFHEWKASGKITVPLGYLSETQRQPVYAPFTFKEKHSIEELHISAQPMLKPEIPGASNVADVYWNLTYSSRTKNLHFYPGNDPQKEIFWLDEIKCKWTDDFKMANLHVYRENKVTLAHILAAPPQSTSLSVWPNPANSIIQSNMHPESRTYILDNNGHLTWSGYVQSKIDVSFLTPGIYFLTNEHGQQVRFVKI